MQHIKRRLFWVSICILAACLGAAGARGQQSVREPGAAAPIKLAQTQAQHYARQMIAQIDGQLGQWTHHLRQLDWNYRNNPSWRAQYGNWAIQEMHRAQAAIQQLQAQRQTYMAQLQAPPRQPQAPPRQTQQRAAPAAPAQSQKPPEADEACNQSCDAYCAAPKAQGGAGAFGGERKLDPRRNQWMTPCLLGVVSEPALGCTCY